MSDSDPFEERAWDRGWKGHRIAQLRRMAALPFSVKLDWLEDAQRSEGPEGIA